MMEDPQDDDATAIGPAIGSPTPFRSPGTDVRGPVTRLTPWSGAAGATSRHDSPRGRPRRRQPRACFPGDLARGGEDLVGNRHEVGPGAAVVIQGAGGGRRKRDVYFLTSERLTEGRRGSAFALETSDGWVGSCFAIPRLARWVTRGSCSWPRR